ncbi:LOW QUALITY PROTEIN: hypothetical protein HID58_073323 [Brassica napus]|uniref:Uncharacterized protein n=1 Tax=Brassica napus TaxID=3708 RepID=A0ABQ7Z785_BRANA|nr:LOW QUALITY PROTEIN: hypothetical protein HID58_073323 [Brassica napus]
MLSRISRLGFTQAAFDGVANPVKRLAGTVPVREFWDSEITWRVGIFPRVVGTSPVRELTAAVKCISDEQLDNADGIVPCTLGSVGDREKPGSHRRTGCTRGLGDGGKIPARNSPEWLRRTRLRTSRRDGGKTQREREGGTAPFRSLVELAELSQLAESRAEAAGEAEAGEEKLSHAAGEAEYAVPVAWGGGGGLVPGLESA